jgi:phage protein D
VRSIDLVAPAFDIRIDGSRTPPDVARAVTSIVVTHEEDSLDHFAITLANEFPEMPFTHGEHRRLLRAGSAVTIKLGYVDALEQVFDGEVTRLNPAFTDEGTTTLTVEGHSRLHRLRGATRTRTFQNATDSDIATQIANQSGLRPSVDATRTRHPYVIQMNQTDFDFLLERARRIGYGLRVEGETLVFGTPGNGGTTACTLVWGTSRDAFAPRTLPLRQFRPTLDATAPVTAITVRGQDAITRDAVAGRGASGDEIDRSGTSAAAVARQAFGGAREASVVDLPVASLAEADEIAKALFNARTLGLITGSGACVGAPAIRAGSTVKLEGLGDAFSGRYEVTQSTHTLDDSGYSTSFNVRRGAIG